MKTTGGRVHGGSLGAGLDPDQVLDFSVNVNPYGPHPAVLAAVRAARLDLYPDPECREARAALAAMNGVSPAEIALGNGAAELFWSLARVLVPAGERVLSVEPTFSEFRAGVEAAGGEVTEMRGDASQGFHVPLAAVSEAAQREQVAAIYLCNPNNPTGRGRSAQEIADLARALAPRVLVLDEAFLPLSELWQDGQRRLPDNVVRVRSLTKEHALPGLRVAYLIGRAAWVTALETVRPAWTVSAGAQAAAVAVAESEGFVRDSRDRLLADERRLRGQLRQQGWDPLPTCTTFFLLHVGDGQAMCRRLVSDHQILVRDCASFGLPAFIRIGSRPAEQSDRLLRALGHPPPSRG